MQNGTTHLDVQKYYGEVLTSSKDLKTNACCSTESLPKELREVMPMLHPEVVERFYGCGSPIPEQLEGCTVLDLGCGTGRDCFLLSKLVGPSGRVIGVDMTPEQLAVGQKHLEYHAQQFGYRQTNVELRHGFIEDLASLGIEDNSIDVVVSNCVINLSPAKRRVFSEIFRVLKPGGELYFSDVFSLRRVPNDLLQDPVLRGECLSGALYLEDFRRLLGEFGCLDYRVISNTQLQIGSPQIEQLIGMIPFRSLTVRAFKLRLEDRCEDYGQVAYYQGTIPGAPHGFRLDDHHLFRTNMPHLVCGNTAMMLGQTRYSAHFKLTGDMSTHYGLFDCAPQVNTEKPEGACC